MNLALLLFVGCLLYSHAKNEWEFDVTSKELAREQWEKFKSTFKKQYGSEEEESFRRQVFLDRVVEVKEHNENFTKGTVSFKKTITKFSDMPHSEFSALMLKCYKPFDSSRADISTFVPPADSDVPDAIDWREKGAVTEIKDQTQFCGSCYAFAAVGALEGQQFLAKNESISLSAQQLLDCSSTYGTQEYESDMCCYGNFGGCFSFVLERGVDTEENYPYIHAPRQCKSLESHVTISDFKIISGGNEEDLKAAVGTVGPIAVAINGVESLQEFTGGYVYYEEDCSNDEEDLNAAFLIVGYGTDPDEEQFQDYWIVKNSWGEDWGESGYFKVARNANNVCGIATQALFPVI